MELKVFNISRHVPQSTVRILFSILGDIIFFDYYSSISRRDGTFECVIVYRELSEAQLAAQLDGTELGDRCLEVRLSQSVDRFDIGFSGQCGESVASLTGRTLLIKTEDMACDLDRLFNDFDGIFRSIELERDLGVGLPPLSARFFLIEFSPLEAAEKALIKAVEAGYTAAEAQKHMQSYTVASGSSSQANNSGTASGTPGNSEEVLIYGIPASKLLDPTTNRSYSKSSSSSLEETKSGNRPPPPHHRSRSRSRSHSRSRHGRRDRDRGYDRHRGSRRSRSRSVGEQRRRN